MVDLFCEPRRLIDRAVFSRTTGRVSAVSGLGVTAEGLVLPVGSICSIEPVDSEPIAAQVVAVLQEHRRGNVRHHQVEFAAQAVGAASHEPGRWREPVQPEIVPHLRHHHPLQVESKDAAHAEQPRRRRQDSRAHPHVQQPRRSGLPFQGALQQFQRQGGRGMRARPEPLPGLDDHRQAAGETSGFAQDRPSGFAQDRPLGGAGNVPGRAHQQFPADRQGPEVGPPRRAPVLHRAAPHAEALGRRKPREFPAKFSRPVLGRRRGDLVEEKPDDQPGRRFCEG